MDHDATWLYAAGLAREREGDPAGARGLLQRAARAGHHRAALDLGSIHERDRNLAAALDLWSFAAQSPDREVAVEAALGFARLAAARDLDPELAVRGDRAAGTLGGHRAAEAERLWRFAAESDHPDAAWAWIGLARLHDPFDGFDGGEPEVALSCYERAERSGHPDAGACALYRLGRLRARRGRERSGAPGALEGASALERGIETEHPAWAPSCAFELAAIRAERGELEAARPLWELTAAATGHSAALAAAAALDELRAEGDPFERAGTVFALGASDRDVLDGFEYALLSLGWEGGVEALEAYSPVRRELGPHRLYCSPAAPRLSERARIEVLVKRTGDRTSLVGLIGGNAEERARLETALRAATPVAGHE